MDGLSFIAALVDSLAWPGVILAAVFLVRKELPSLVATLRRLKYNELEIEFEASAKAPAVLGRIDAVIVVEPQCLSGLLFPAFPEQGPVGLGQGLIAPAAKDLDRVTLGPRGAGQVPLPAVLRLHHHKASSNGLPAQEF